MATDTPAVEEEHADHLSPANYWMIALFLGIVTAVEVGINTSPDTTAPFW